MLEAWRLGCLEAFVDLRLSSFLVSRLRSYELPTS
jgi:hypothetical protein